jgi:chorismate mutase
MNIAAARAAQRLPGLRRVPLARLVVLGELAMLAKLHFERLSPAERRRLVMLLKNARGWPRNLSEREQRELKKLVAKVEPKALANEAVERFTPLVGRR